MAKKYNVPLNRLYPASAPPAPPVATLPPEEEESDEDYSDTFPGQPSDNMNNDLDEQDEGDTSYDDDNNQETPSARPQRERRPPAWMRLGEFDLGAE